MDRYIDAELLRELIDFGLDVDFDEVPETKQALLDMIDYQETADVAPVIHAHWETTKLTSKWIFVCSHCHYGWYESYECEDIAWKYCPDCGAKMDEEVEDA